MNAIKVDRAIILAAGLGSRMRPVTEDLPKPLVRVLGQRIIETSIKALLAANITDIYVVCGYLADKFQSLKSEYPMLKFIMNEGYAEANNISSILCAKELLQNAYIIEGDLFVRNASLISPTQTESNYLGIYTHYTNDWCLTTDSDGYINKLTIGGRECYQMVGISYWTEEDGAKLARHSEKVFALPDGKTKYWDEVALSIFKSDYKIKVRECRFEDITEIDTLAELQALDPSYL